MCKNFKSRKFYFIAKKSEREKQTKRNLLS